MVHEIIDKREELYRLYVEYKRDIVESSVPFPLMSCFSELNDSPNADYSGRFITPEGARFRAEYVPSQFFDHLLSD